MGLRERIMDHEGFRSKPYKDTVGKLTIGFGRNLEDVGISEIEGQILLDNDLTRARRGALFTWPWMTDLPFTVQEVLIEMTFNMGVGGVLTFKKFLTALQRHDFMTAADEMLNSQWAQQVGARAVTLANVVRSGTTEV